VGEEERGMVWVVKERERLFIGVFLWHGFLEEGIWTGDKMQCNRGQWRKKINEHDQETNWRCIGER